MFFDEFVNFDNDDRDLVITNLNLIDEFLNVMKSALLTIFYKKT